MNSDATTTNSQSVTLNNSSTGGPTHYAASESVSFDGATWMGYSGDPAFVLSSGDGLKTVYFKLRNAGGESAVHSDTITLETPLPLPEVSFLALDNGAASTTSQSVTLDNNCTGNPTHYMASESSAFIGSAWLEYSSATDFTLSDGAGLKTVHFKVKNSTGESTAASDFITIEILASGYVFDRMWPEVEWFLGIPASLAVDSTGNVYLADRGNNCILKFSDNGVFLSKWGSVGSGDGQFRSPYGVAVDAIGNVYVADTWNNRIQRFTAAGVFQAAWGIGGTGDGEFAYPIGVSIGSTGDVFVSDHWNDRIQKFLPDGTFVAKWGSTGNGPGQFNRPGRVAVDSDGNVYVTDLLNHRIQKFRPE